VNSTDPAVSAGIRKLIIECCEAEITQEDIDAADGVLVALNYTSLSFIRMLDAIENEFGVYIDLEQNEGKLSTADALIGAVTELLAEVDA
jgi:acyl carrier protein